MAAQGCCAAELDVGQGLELFLAEGMLPAVILSVVAKDFRDLELGAYPLRGVSSVVCVQGGGSGLGSRAAYEIKWALGATDKVDTDMGVPGGGSDGAMSQEGLNYPHILSRLEKMRGIAMAQGVEGDMFCYAGFVQGFGEDLGHGFRADWLIRVLSGKKIGPLGTHAPVILLQEGQ